MSSLRKPEASTRGTPATQTSAQIFAELQNMAEFYLKPDLERIASETILQDRDYLEQVSNLNVAATGWLNKDQVAFKKKFKLLEVPIDKIILCFYKAPQHMDGKVFKDPYYNHMRDAVAQWKKIREVL
jgi:hypothetical protein